MWILSLDGAVGISTTQAPSCELQQGAVDGLLRAVGGLALTAAGYPSAHGTTRHPKYVCLSSDVTNRSEMEPVVPQ